MTQEQATEELQPGKDVYNAEQWIKKRIFVRELAGKYGEVYRELYNQPRVYKSKDKPWKAGPVIFHKGIINPQHAMATQAIQTELDTLAPGGHSKVIDTAI